MCVCVCVCVCICVCVCTCVHLKFMTIQLLEALLHSKVIKIGDDCMTGDSANWSQIA